MPHIEHGIELVDGEWVIFKLVRMTETIRTDIASFISEDDARQFLRICESVYSMEAIVNAGMISLHDGDLDP